MPEPLGVAFVEIVPETTGFKAATEAQISRDIASSRVVVPVSAPGAGAAAGELRGVKSEAQAAAGAETLLASASEKLAAAQAPVAELTSRVARARLAAASAAEADAAAQRALLAITSETDAAIVAEIDALVADTAALNAKASAELRAATASQGHAVASREAADAVLAETATMTGLRGASLGVNPAFLAATAAAIVFFKSADEASNFQEQMHLIQATTGAAEEQMKQASDTARRLGSDLSLPATSAVDAATAIAQLTRSGFSLDQAMTVAHSTLLLTSAAQTDLGTSTDIVTRLLRAYNLNVTDAADVTDALTTATLSGAGSTEEWAAALTSVAPVAHTLGLSIRDTTTFLIQMAQGGIGASQAGTLLRQSLLRLAGGSTQVLKGLKSIHLSLRDLEDAQGNLRPDAFVILARATADLTRQQQRQVLTQIFSIRGIRAVLPLIDQAAAGYEAASEKAGKLGTTQEQATAREKSFGGQTKELKKNLGDLGLTLGETVTPAILGFVGALNKISHSRGFELLTAPDRKVGGLVGLVTNLKDFVTLTAHGQLANFGELPTEAVHRLNREAAIARAQVPKVNEELDKLFQTARKEGGGPTAVNELVLALIKLRDSEDTSTEAGAKAAKGIDKIIKQLQAAGVLPPVNLKIGFDLPNPSVLKTTGKTAADKLRAGLLTGVPALDAWANTLFPSLATKLDSKDPILENSGRKAAAAFLKGIGSLTGGKLDTAAAVAEATSGDASNRLLAIRRRQLAEARDALRKAQALPNATGKDTAVRKAAEAVSQREAQVQSILDQQSTAAAQAASDRKAAADKAASAAADAERSFIEKRVTTKEQHLQNRLSDAEETAGLKDDIARSIDLRNFYAATIREIKRRIRTEHLTGEALKVEQDELATLGQAYRSSARDVRRLRREQRAAQREQRLTAAENRVQSAQLDVDLITGGVTDPSHRTAASIRKEVAAREAVIKALRAQQRLTKRGTVEWKQLRNDIAEQQRAIAELRKQRGQGQAEVLALQKQEFAFMQTIQGFTFSLIGNLIPGGASGLVGGGGGAPSVTSASTTTGTATDLRQVPGGFEQPRGKAVFARAGAPQSTNRPTAAGGRDGVTRGQGNAQIDLLRKIYAELRTQSRRGDHPEARGQRRRGTATGDVHIQGTIGM